LLASLGLLPAFAIAQTTSLDRSFPSDPSTADDVIISVAFQCLLPAEQAPGVEVTGDNSYTIIYEHGGPFDACPTVLPPITGFPTNIGKLPAGQQIGRA